MIEEEELDDDIFYPNIYEYIDSNDYLSPIEVDNQDLIKKIQSRTNLNPEDIQVILGAFFSELRNIFINMGEIGVFGWGKFKPKGKELSDGINFELHKTYDKEPLWQRISNKYHPKS